MFMYKKHFKRIFDFSGAMLLTAALALLVGTIAVIIKAQGSGPVLFRQERPGKNGKLFTIYKFRTMSCELFKGEVKLSDVDRTTRFGAFLRKTSLDELPQLFNVLRGEMSFIGPRPLLKEYLSLYSPRQSRRHEVLPGITGFAQVNGRNAITWEQKFEYDVWYVEHQSFWLDMKILWMTFLKVVQRSDISSNTSATMEKFERSEK